MLPYSETKYEDMMKALEHIQKYVPFKNVERELPVPGQDAATFQDKDYVMTLIGGDQLTVSRIRGAQTIRGNSGRSEHKLDGFLPVTEDWHAKMCFLGVKTNLVGVYN